jgi:hypothetical protein
MSEYTTKDAVKMAMDGNASGFRDAINDLLMDRVQDAVQVKKLDVAANFMSSESQEELEIEGETDGDQEV